MDLSTIASILASSVTAIATIALCWVTWILAHETKRLADIGSRPTIIVTIEPNDWSLLWANIKVGNFGNNAAYDIRIEFIEPTNKMLEGLRNNSFPFKTISVLRPDQVLVSDIGPVAPYLDEEVRVEVSWANRPGDRVRSSVSYEIGLKHYHGMQQIGGNPIVEIASQMKKLREDWKQVASGNRRIRADIYDIIDRKVEAKERDAMIRKLRRQAKAECPNDPDEQATPTSPPPNVVE